MKLPIGLIAWLWDEYPERLEPCCGPIRHWDLLGDSYDMIEKWILEKPNNEIVSLVLEYHTELHKKLDTVLDESFELFSALAKKSGYSLDNAAK